MNVVQAHAAQGSPQLPPPSPLQRGRGGEGGEAAASALEVKKNHEKFWKESLEGSKGCSVCAFRGSYCDEWRGEGV